MIALDASFLIDYLDGVSAAGEFVKDHREQPLHAPAQALFEVYRAGFTAARTPAKAGFSALRMPSPGFTLWSSTAPEPGQPLGLRQIYWTLANG